MGTNQSVVPTTEPHRKTGLKFIPEGLCSCTGLRTVIDVSVVISDLGRIDELAHGRNVQ
jgi:hypothetical protein